MRRPVAGLLGMAARMVARGVRIFRGRPPERIASSAKTMSTPDDPIGTVRSRARCSCGHAALAFALIVALAPGIRAQDRLKTMPGYEQFQAMAKKTSGALASGSPTVKWLEGGKALEYRKD